MSDLTRASIGCAVLALVALPAGPAHGTAQRPEQLLHRGKTLPLYSEPLERRFSDGAATYWEEPVNGPPRRRPKVFQAHSTACWRGYQGTWKIERGELWLVKLQECDLGEGKVIPIGAVFPGETLPLKASWYSGVLRVPVGKQLQYVHMGFHSTYEQDLFIAVRAGQVVAEQTVDNRDKATAARGCTFRERLTEQELAQALMGARRDLARCARLGRERGTVAIEIQPDGAVSGVKLARPLIGTATGRCLFSALARLRYPVFFGPPVRTRHQLP